MENKKLEEIYKNEGIVIYVKGEARIMIHPDNVENNAKALNNGDMKIDWKYLVSGKFGK